MTFENSPAGIMSVLFESARADTPPDEVLCLKDAGRRGEREERHRDARVHMLACILVYVYRHTQVHVCTDTHKYTCMCTDTHKYTFMCTVTHKYTFMCTDTHKYTCVLTHTSTRVYRHIDMSRDTQLHTGTDTCNSCTCPLCLFVLMVSLSLSLSFSLSLLLSLSLSLKTIFEAES